MKKPILCRLGLHNWGKPVKHSYSFQSNVYECKRQCQRCGKTKRWVEKKPGLE